MWRTNPPPPCSPGCDRLPGLGARTSYVASYFDGADRLTCTVDVGTNGGSSYTRPSSVPSRSDTVLVTSQVYNNAGWVSDVIDPRGIDNQTLYDALGRTTQTIQNYTGSGPTTSSDQTTAYTYDGDNHTLTVTVDLPSSAIQETQYVYGVSTSAGSYINSNGLLATTEYPDPSTGSPSTSTTQQEAYTYNALGQVLTYKDRNGTVHAYTYDVLGRPTRDTITTLGSGVDGSVRRIDTAYDTQGNAYLVTSYSDTAGTTVVNQVETKYNGLGQLTNDYQAHSGTANTSTTPQVQYAYSLMAGGANNSRLTSITYPNGKVLTYNYNSGTGYAANIDNNISRLSSISDSTGTVEALTYLGLSTVVKQVDGPIQLTYIGTGTGDAGDQYTGLDRFGRIAEQLWQTSGGTPTTTDDFLYGYDRDSNALYKLNNVNTSFSELYHANGSGNGYDGLNRIVSWSQGTLNSAHDTISSPTNAESFTMDAVGNFTSVVTNGTTVTETANKQNEVTGVSGSTTPVYDHNGNMTTDQNGNTLIYDAWNRLVQVKNSGGTTLISYTYDGLGRRITETRGSATTDLYYSTAGQVLEERVSGTALYQYVWSPTYVNALVLRDELDTSVRLWVQHDANYNVTAIVSNTGSVDERYTNDPYGNVTVLTPSWGSRTSSSFAWMYSYQDGRFEILTGLFHFGSPGRDYSPTLRIWASADPAHFAAGTNFYAFVRNRPMTATDPSGYGPLFSGWYNPFQADFIGFEKPQALTGTPSYLVPPPPILNNPSYSQRAAHGLTVVIVMGSREERMNWASSARQHYGAGALIYNNVYNLHDLAITMQDFDLGSVDHLVISGHGCRARGIGCQVANNHTPAPPDSSRIDNEAFRNDPDSTRTIAIRLSNNALVEFQSCGGGERERVEDAAIETANLLQAEIRFAVGSAGDWDEVMPGEGVRNPQWATQRPTEIDPAIAAARVPWDQR